MPLAYQAMLDSNRKHPESKEIYKIMQKWHLEHEAVEESVAAMDLISNQ